MKLFNLLLYVPQIPSIRIYIHFLVCPELNCLSPTEEKEVANYGNQANIATCYELLN